MSYDYWELCFASWNCRRKKHLAKYGYGRPCHMSSPGGRTSQVGKRRFRGLGSPALARCWWCPGLLALPWGAPFASGSWQNTRDFIRQHCWACEEDHAALSRWLLPGMRVLLHPFRSFFSLSCWDWYTLLQGFGRNTQIKFEPLLCLACQLADSAV